MFTLFFISSTLFLRHMGGPNYASGQCICKLFLVEALEAHMCSEFFDIGPDILSRWQVPF